MPDRPLILRIPDGLMASGSAMAEFLPVMALADLPDGAMRRVTHGDLDVLVANTPAGLLATDDRCPHMSAPLSLGRLEDCVVDCPLHSGRFDLASGDIVQFPTTGGLDPDGLSHPPWRSPDSPPKPEPTDSKAVARAATRVRRLRYYRLRVTDGIVEVALPTP
ncbi:MAG TPA: Rieske 2Fe-2S domain-containing protein [Candidatus Limnocylindrales bacterium]|jgi:nitrite reductase/ring-hydroxylating ferredoxin subunit